MNKNEQIIIVMKVTATSMNRPDVMVMMIMTMRCQEELVLPKSPLPVRPFLIRYMAQDKGPELEKAPGFILQSWVQMRQWLGSSFQCTREGDQGIEKQISREKYSKRENSKREMKEEEQENRKQ